MALIKKRVQSLDDNADFQTFSQWTKSDQTDEKSDAVAGFMTAVVNNNTRERYKHSINQFFAFCEKMDVQFTHFSELTPKIFRCWQKFMEADLSSSTIHLRLAALSSLYDFLMYNEALEKNPVRLVDRLVVTVKRGTNSLTHDELRRLLATVADSARTHVSIRERRITTIYHACFFLFATTGFRASELFNLTLDDVVDFDTDAMGFKIKAKGGESRTRYIQGTAHDLLREYILHTHGTFFNEEAHKKRYLFSHDPNFSKPLVLVTVTDALKRFARQADIKKRISLHSFRATVATLMYEMNKNSIYDIKEQLGHKDISTTAIYIKRSDEKKVFTKSFF